MNDARIESTQTAGARLGGKVGGVKLARDRDRKRSFVGAGESRVSAGRVRADRYYSYEELPEAEQRTHDWAADSGAYFVRVRYGSRFEFVPRENFQRVEGGKAPSGRPAEGFASDSYFSGVALRDISGNEGSDHEYQVWAEYW